MSSVEALPLFMTVVSSGMTAAGAGVQAYGQHMQGREAAGAAAFEQQQLETQARMLRTSADQSEAKRRNELTSSLETIAALRAGRGVGAYSPTAEAIYGNAIQGAEGDIATERTNILTKADLSQRASIMAERKARTSLLAGDLAATSTLLSAGAKVAGTLGYLTTKKPGMAATFPVA